MSVGGSKINKTQFLSSLAQNLVGLERVSPGSNYATDLTAERSSWFQVKEQAITHPLKGFRENVLRQEEESYVVETTKKETQGCARVSFCGPEVVHLP